MPDQGFQGLLCVDHLVLRSDQLGIGAFKACLGVVLVGTRSQSNLKALGGKVELLLYRGTVELRQVLVVQCSKNIKIGRYRTPDQVFAGNT